MPTPLRSLCGALLALALLVIPPAAHASDAFEIIPSAGLGKPTGKGADGYSPGVNLSLSLGGRFSPFIALHGQFAYDRLGMDNYRGVSSTGYVVRVLVVPSLHLVGDRLDLSIAPTLGVFAVSARSEALGQQVETSVRGRQLGAQAMILYTLNRTVALGPTFSYARMWATNFCSRIGSRVEACDGEPSNDDEGFWNAGLAARF
jgi:hypothetical protein